MGRLGAFEFQRIETGRFTGMRNIWVSKGLGVSCAVEYDQMVLNRVAGTLNFNYS